MSEASLVQPPRIALWLIDLFTPDRQAESIPGDLLEEFSLLASKSGVASARSWYWRQSARTIVHLVGAGFRAAPWLMACVLVAGFLLFGFANQLPDKVIAAVTNRRLAYYQEHFNAYMFWMGDGILIGRVIVSMFVGCLVALAAKGREMVATVTLGLVLDVGLLLDVLGYLPWVAKHWPDYGFQLPFLMARFASSIAIIIGGGIVRKSRSAVARRY